MQFRNINGFQNTLLAPIFNENNKSWQCTSTLESRAAPTAQIHHNGENHWVASLQRKGGRIYVLDSLYKNKLSSSLQIQLAYIYGCGLNNLTVYVPNIQQQEIGTADCGVFAIANIVEFCITGYKELEMQSRSWNFEMSKCRKHLVACLKSKLFIPFPKFSLPNEIKMDVDKFCIASLPLWPSRSFW